MPINQNSFTQAGLIYYQTHITNRRYPVLNQPRGPTQKSEFFAQKSGIYNQKSAFAQKSGFAQKSFFCSKVRFFCLKSPVFCSKVSVCSKVRLFAQMSVCSNVLKPNASDFMPEKPARVPPHTLPILYLKSQQE